MHLCHRANLNVHKDNEISSIPSCWFRASGQRRMTPCWDLLLKRKALELVSRWAHSSPGEACHNILLSHPICPWSIDQSAYLGNCTQVRCNRLRHPETWLMVNHADHSTGTLNWILPPAWNIGARQRWTSSGSPPHANSYVWVFILLVVVWGINTVMFGLVDLQGYWKCTCPVFMHLTLCACSWEIRCFWPTHGGS